MANEHIPQAQYEPGANGPAGGGAGSAAAASPSDGGEDGLIDRLKRKGGDINLSGQVSEQMARDLFGQLNEAVKEGDPLVIEVTTTGGDAEMARRMVLDIDRARRRLNRRLVFLGSAVVYSAGTTIMSAFPCEDRFLDGDAMVMIHCRQLAKTLEIDGPIRASRPQVEALLHQIDIGIDLETRNFERLIEGSDITLEELRERALYNWYLTAAQARERGLVAAVI